MWYPAWNSLDLMSGRFAYVSEADLPARIAAERAYAEAMGVVRSPTRSVCAAVFRSRGSMT